MRNALVSLTLMFIAIAGLGQPKNGTATATGQCSIAISGNNNTVPTENGLSGSCGIGKEQGDKIVRLLNTVLAKRDAAEINGKLDELIALASKPVQQVVNCGNAGNCAGTNNGTQTFNQYGAPKLVMTDAQRDAIRDAMKPFAGKTVGIICNNATEDTMAYANQLSKALKDAGMNAGTPISAMLLTQPGKAFPNGPLVVVGENGLAAAEALGVVHQEIVVIESCSGDGGLLVEAGVWPMPVVLVGEGYQRCGSLL